MRFLTAGAVFALLSWCGVGHAVESCQIGGKFPPPDPKSVTMSMSMDVGGGNTLGVYQCLLNLDKIDCYFVYTRNQANSQDYNITPDHLKRIKMFDDANELHMTNRAYYCNRRGKPMQDVNLGTGDVIWLVYEFDGAASDINRARIIYPQEWTNRFIEVRSPVMKQF